MDTRMYIYIYLFIYLFIPESIAKGSSVRSSAEKIHGKDMG